MPYIIYAELKSLIKKVDGYTNNTGKSSTTKICEQVFCGYSMLTTWA